MKEDNKVILTIAIWFSMAGISIATLIASSNLNHAEMLVGALVFTALVASGAIWDDKDKKKESEKSKRSSKRNDDKLALLMDLMDEEERQAFKETLKQQYTQPDFSQDGEIPYHLYDEEYSEVNHG